MLSAIKTGLNKIIALDQKEQMRTITYSMDLLIPGLYSSGQNC